MKQFFISIVLALVVGLLSGTMATIVTQNYLDQYAASLESSAWWESLSEQRPRETPDSYEEAIAAARIELLPSLVLFYTAASSATLLPGSEVGAGVVVTSDGWVLTSRRAIGNRAFVGSEEYEITQTIFDSLTDAALVKLEASGLPVIAFGDANALQGGELLFAGTGPSALLPVTLLDPSAWSASSSVNTAESFVSQFAYDETVALAGSPVVDATGALVAVGTIPLQQVEQAMTGAIRNTRVIRASFGAYVTDLSFVHLDRLYSRGFSSGARIVSITPQSPAAKAGIRSGDIVLRLQDVPVSRTETLAEILAAFDPGKKVSVEIDRDGERMTVEVELKEL